MADEIGAALDREQITSFVNARPLRVEGNSGDHMSVTISVSGSEYAIEGSHILVATGRVANTADIGLDSAGIEVTKCGFVKVAERLRTTVPGVWAFPIATDRWRDRMTIP